MFDIFKSKQERLQTKVEKFVSLQNEFSGVNTRIDELAIEFATRDSEFKKALEQEKDEFIKGRIESKYQEFIKSHLKNIGTVKREKESLMKAMEKVYSDDPEFQEILAEEKLHKSYNAILSNYRSNKIDLNTCDTLLKAVQHKYIRKTPDGKGGWNYVYEEEKEKEKKQEEIDDFDFYSKNTYKEGVEFVPINEIEKFKEFDREIQPKWGEGDTTLDELYFEIKKEGLKNPVRLEIREGKGLIVEGNHRLAVLKRLGLNYIPVKIEESNRSWKGTVYEKKAKDIDKGDSGFNKYKNEKRYNKPIYDTPLMWGFNSKTLEQLKSNNIQKSETTFPFMQPYLETISEALKNKKETGKVKYADNIVFNKEGKLLLLKRSENDKTFAGMYVIPGGHVDLGEDCDVAAKRELYEEAGIEVEEVRFVGEYEDKKVHIKYYESHTDKDPILQQEEIWGYEWVELKDLDNYPMPLNMCENIKKVLNPYGFKQQVVKIKKALEDDLINPSQYKALIRNVLEKAKKAHSGEIRTWGNDRMQKQPDGSWKKLFDSKEKKKEELVLDSNEEIYIDDAYYLRFQDTTNIQTSVHPYPTEKIVNLYKNKDKVKEAIKRVNDGEIEWDNLLNYYDEEDFRLKDGYVCAVNFDNEDKLKVSNQNFKSTPSASDKFVTLFEGDYEDEHEIFDGLITKMKNVKAIYEKTDNGYKLIQKDGKSVKIIKGNIAKSTESTLQKALEDNLITPKQYDLLLEKSWTKHPVGTVVTRKDGTRWKKISETGNSKADWKQITKDKGSKPEDAKEAKNSAKEEGQTQNPTNLAEAAKNASETALNEAIKTSGDENVRQAAHEELNRRDKEEKVQEEPEKKEEGKETEKKKLTVKDKVEELSGKYKDLMTEAMNDDFSDSNKTSEYSKKQKEYARYIQRVREFDSIDKEEHLKKAQELLDLKSEKEVKDFFGDGEIIGISVEDEIVSVLTEDTYCQRGFGKNGIVDMLEFVLNPDLDKGQGKGSEIFYNQVQSFKNKGYKKLITEAAKSDVYNGYYTWARLGYEIRNRAGRRNIGIENFRQLLNKLQNDKELKDVKTVSELMTTKKGRDFWKENGFAFNAEFDLSDDSKSMFILKKYMEEKKNARK